MTYLDYSANTPVDPDVLTAFCQTERTYICNPNSTHGAGREAQNALARVTDSMLMAKLMQEFHRHSNVPFDLVFLVMDPGYNEINRQKIESNAALLHISITIFETNIFAVANNSEKSSCYLCARMRRGHLYSKARELGCNKIALGHHFNDVIETTVMGMFFGSQLQAMPPKLRSTNFVGMELIRPFTAYVKRIFSPGSII